MRPTINYMERDIHKFEVSAILTEYDILARCEADK